MLNVLIRWLVFFHVLAAITFFLAHGAAAAMAFQVRKEKDFARIRAMLDLSVSTFMLMLFSFVLMGLTGLILPFPMQLWNKGYIWVSIVLMLFTVTYMGIFNETHYKRLRRLVGLPYMKGSKQYPAEPPASQEEVETLIRNTSLTPLILTGYVIPAFVLWLMVFKPF